MQTCHFSVSLQSFIEDELARAPLLIDGVLQTLVDGARHASARSTPPWAAPDFAQIVGPHRRSVVAAFVDSLRQQVDAAGASPAPPSAGAGDAELSLVDEAAVAADVELSRTVELVSVAAEYELRELGAYTSSLVGDMNVARNTNPFGPSVYARALWAGAQALPTGATTAVALMRSAAPLLAQALRRSYAAACTRLEDAGIEPALHRTVILATTAREAVSASTAAPEPAAAGDLHAWQAHVTASMRGALDAAPAPEAPAVDQQHIELLACLFDAIALDPHAPDELKTLLARLQGSVLRVSLQEPQVLRDLDHVVWQAMDRLAFGFQLHARNDDPVRAKVLRYAQVLTENIQRAESHDAGLYRWALQRIGAFEAHLLQARLAAVADRIAGLERLLRAPTEPVGVSSSAVTRPMDVNALETVPSALYEALDGPRSRERAEPRPAIDGQPPGAWFHAFLAGGWRAAQLLWVGGAGDIWLLGEAGTQQTWALTGAARDRLHAEGLLKVLRPRSLARAAARRALRRA